MGKNWPRGKNQERGKKKGNVVRKGGAMLCIIKTKGFSVAMSLCREKLLGVQARHERKDQALKKENQRKKRTRWMEIDLFIK